MDVEFVFPFPVIAVPWIGTLGLPRCVEGEQRLHFDRNILLEFANNSSDFPKFEMPVIKRRSQRDRNAQLTRDIFVTKIGIGPPLHDLLLNRSRP